MIATQERPHTKVLFPGRFVATPRECAKALNVTERHILNLIDEGVLHCFSIQGPRNRTPRRCRRITIESLEAFLQQRYS